MSARATDGSARRIRGLPAQLSAISHRTIRTFAVAILVCISSSSARTLLADEPLSAILDRLEQTNHRLNRSLSIESRTPAGAQLIASKSDSPAIDRRIRVLVSGGEISAHAIQTLAEELDTRIASDWSRDSAGSGSRIALNVNLGSSDDKALTLTPLRPDDPLYRIRISSPDIDTFRTVLAHELTHVVLHQRFGDSLPPWFDEGLASREDAPHRVRIRQQIVDGWTRSGRFPAIDRVIQRERIDADDVQSYAVSTTLVDFLLTRLSHSELEQLIDTTIASGWPAAVRRTEFESTAELEAAWRDWLLRRKLQPQAARAENRTVR